MQADAYGGYDGIYHTEGVTEVACWAHARRKFYDAQDSDGKRAAEMLALVGQLYAIEREAKGAANDVRLALRRERSMPVLAKIKAWLDTEGEVVLPRSPMAAAMGYAKNQWGALNVYVTQGFLNIDNNAAERALKRVAIGRKNWRAPDVPRRTSGRSPASGCLVGNVRYEPWPSGRPSVSRE